MRSGGECSLPLTVPVCCRANRFSHDRKHFDWYLSYVSGKTSLLGSPRNHSSFPKVQTRDVGGKKAEWGNFSSQYLNYKVLRLFLIHVLSQGSPCSILAKTKRVKLLMYEFMSFILKLFLFFLFYCSKWCNLLHTNLIWSEHSGSIKWAITVHKSKFHIGNIRLVFINVEEHPTQYAFNSCKKKRKFHGLIDLKVAPAPLFNISKCSRVFDDLDERYLPVIY